MAAAGHSGPGPDLYRLLGVPREASQQEIALAWRRRARAEHPDYRPGEAAAPGRFRALAEAYQVLGDPARRAAYDRALTRDQAAARIPAPLVRAPAPPLRAGPVRVEAPRPASAAGVREEEEARLAVLAELVLRYLARDWDRPW
jgi:curved DNA-binding protein CbpA